MEFTGFVKISRNILDSCIWEDGYDAALYFFFLLRASHNFYGKLKPGQFYASVVSIAKALGWSRNGTAKHISSLTYKGLISVSRDSDGTLYTVIGWSEICQEKARISLAPRNNPRAHKMGVSAHDMNDGAQDMSIQCQQNEHNQNNKGQEKPRTYSYREKAFEIFWKAYPRHEERSAARKAWMEMDIPTDTLMAALENAKYSREWRQDNGKYIPRAAKWLDGKWEDYIDQSEREERSAWKEY